MEVEHTSNLPPDEQSHLDKLKALVEEALADGRLSHGEIQNIRSLLMSDRQVTAAELDTVHNTIRELLGDAFLEFDWR